MVYVPFFTLTALLAALALFVWRAHPDSPVNRWFGVFTILVASWVLGVGGLQGGANLDIWARFTFSSASLIPASFLAFMRVYPTSSRWPSSIILRSTLIVGGSIAIVSLTTPLMVYDTSITTESSRE